MSSTRLFETDRTDLSFIKEQPAQEIVYPDSDGKPMGETGFHVIAILHLFDALRRLLQNTPNVYVAADMFLYYEKGNPRANKAPDVMVIKGVSKQTRRSFKTWEEGAAPCVIFEVTSKSTQTEDMTRKGHIYATLGVREYFIFDPLREYIEHGITGMRLDEDGEYVDITPEGPGTMFSEELGIFLMVEDARLRVIDPLTHKPIPDNDESARLLRESMFRAEQEAQRAEQEAQRAEQEAQRAEQESQRAEQEAQRAEQEARRAEQEACRAEQAEAELAQLRALLKAKGENI